MPFKYSTIFDLEALIKRRHLTTTNNNNILWSTLKLISIGGNF